MDQEYSRVDITEILVQKYQKQLRPEIKTVCILQMDDVVWLETLSVSLIASRHWTKETMERIDLHFISDDGEGPMFDPKDEIETNAIKFVDQLTPYSLVNVTNLFTEEASDTISKKYNIFGVDGHGAKQS